MVAVLEKYQMLSLAENVVKTALHKGAAEAEAYVYEGQATNVGIERGQITKTNTIIDRGLGVRVTVNKAVGFAYTNIIEAQNAVEDTITGALSAARASKPDPDWNGLPEKKAYVAADKIFDPFFTTKPTGEGTGLGLSLAHRIIEDQGGTLRIESTVGEGTTVEARFELDNVDRPPLGDIASTVWTLVATNRGVEFDYRHTINGACFAVNTVELKETLTTNSLTKARVAAALLKYLREHERRLAEGSAS